LSEEKFPIIRVIEQSIATLTLSATVTDLYDEVCDLVAIKSTCAELRKSKTENLPEERREDPLIVSIDPVVGED
jgi:hypothetical protein